jgi:hypothetical protein
MSEEGMDEGSGRGTVGDALTLARLAVGASIRTAEWTVNASLRATGRVARAARSSESAADLLQDVGEAVRDYARELLGVDIDERVRSVVPDAVVRAASRPNDDGGPTLRDRGAELLRRSADVDDAEDAHPAYGRILGDLAPDEARILRLLALEGAQPAIDVRAGKALILGSELVAPGLSMIGAQAGCRYLDRVPAYLNNLYRLGLIWFSREPLDDPLRYQVLEAQPDVLEALRSPGRTTTVRRSILLTPFGEDFCKTVLPLDITGEFEALNSEQPVEEEGEAR